MVLVTISDNKKEDFMKGFGKILIELRGSNTQEKVAKDLGIATSTLGMYETEKRIPRDSIKMRISEYYRKPVQYIFFSQNVTVEDKISKNEK